MAAPGDVVSTVWYVERTVQAASTRKVSMSASETVSCISRLAVRNMLIKTLCSRSSIAFACGFLTVVGLRLIPYDVHRDANSNLNSLPLSKMMYLGLG